MFWISIILDPTLGPYGLSRLASRSIVQILYLQDVLGHCGHELTGTCNYGESAIQQDHIPIFLVSTSDLRSGR